MFGHHAPPVRRVGLTIDQAFDLRLVPVEGSTDKFEMDAVPQEELLRWCQRAYAPLRSDASDRRRAWSEEQDEALATDEPLDAETLLQVEWVDAERRCEVCEAPLLCR